MSAEASIRAYLIALQDPEMLLDKERIETLETELAAEQDPLSRVIYRQRLLDAQNTDALMEELTSKAVVDLPAFAEEFGIGVDSLRAEGVPLDVLQQAGLVSANRKVRARRSRSAGTGRKTPSGPRVSREDVFAWMEAQTEPFTQDLVVSATGASKTTVRGLISELGLRKVGQAASGTVGRQPNLYAPPAPEPPPSS